MNPDDPPKILLVDDEEMVRRSMKGILEEQGFGFAGAANGQECLEMVKKLHPDLILLDITMPIMDGFETCRRLKENADTDKIPVVMFTSHTDTASRIKALEAGANDFLGKPVDKMELIVRVKNLLKVKQYQDFLEEHSKIMEEQVAIRTRELKEALMDTAHRLTLASEYRDEDTYTHIKRISYYTEVLVNHLGISHQDSEIMVCASPMHDIGKVGIPDHILLKPGELTPEEFEIMKTHTTIGARILKGSESPYLKSAVKFALNHHERWDGTGYPQGLRGEEIPLEGRIMNIVDQYDALRSNRPYKPPFGHEKAVSIIVEGGGKTKPEHFDPRILAVFRDCAPIFQQIFEAHQD